MMNIVDRLIENTIKTKNPTVVGLDPNLRKIPACYKVNSHSTANPLPMLYSHSTVTLLIPYHRSFLP